MSTTEVHSPSRGAAVGKVDLHLEVQIIPVSDIDRSKQFYQRLGWRLDADVAPLDGLRIVQFTPPGSGASVTFGTGLTTAAPGSAEGGLIVSDIEAAHDELAGRGIDASDDLARPAVPRRGTPARPRPRAHQLRVVLLLQRSRRQHLAGPGGHHPAPRPDRRRGHGLRVHRGPGRARCGGPRPPTREHEKRAGRSHLFHRSGHDEDWPAWYAAYLVAEQAGTDLPA